MNRKRFWLMTAVVVFVLSGMGPIGSRRIVRAANVGTEVDIGFFYDRLAPFGEWAELSPYGWVWTPYGMPIGWRPYTDGHWVYTDDYGWLWDSDFDNWGWACFHYGRWDWDDSLGWFWVPGYHWAPAWVAWRRGAGYIGWAPLPPQVRWQIGVGLEFDHFDLDEIPPRDWIFIQAQYFDAPRIRNHVLLPYRNDRFFHDTENATRFEIHGGHVFNGGVSLGWIQGETHRPIEHYHIRHVDNAAAMRLPREHDGEISIFSPGVRRGPEGLRPPGPGEIERRQEAERAQLQERQRAEELRQEQRHQAERAAPGINAERLQRQQEAERQALRSEQEREFRQLNNEQQRERGRFQRPFGEPGRMGERQQFQRPSSGAPRMGEGERFQRPSGGGERMEGRGESPRRER